MPLRVRPATEKDLPQLLALYRELNPDDSVLDPARAKRIWCQIAEQPGRTVLLAMHGDNPVGTVDCTVVANLTRGGRSFLQLENMEVSGENRREGIGLLLLEEVRRHAVRNQCYKIQLLTDKAPNSALRFYEAAGYSARAEGYRMYLS